MRKKLLLLALALIAFGGALSPRAEAAGNHACPICTTYPDGSQCCVSCFCNAQGIPVACTDHFCPEP